jgi:hypothetical protein
VASEFTGDTKDRDILMTRYMINLMQNLGGRVEEFINPTKYIYSMIDSALERMIKQDPASTTKSDGMKMTRRKKAEK